MTTHADGPQVVGVGTDVVEVARIAASVERRPGVAARIWTRAELASCTRPDGSLDHRRLAARFAAKEAVAKALGTGLVGFWLTDVEIARAPGTGPTVRLGPRAARVASERGAGDVHVSMSTTSSLAVAHAIAVRRTHHGQDESPATRTGPG